VRTTLGEHLGYIADSRRLDRFRSALTATIRPGDTVADLGCGLGVLGLLSLEAGAAHVWGIDSSDAIEIARETMARAGLAGRYTCLRERTRRACLPERVDVLVCDHVGYFGVDYGIIEMLADARRRLLKPGGRIVPAGLRLLIAGVASAAVREQAEAWAQPDIPEAYRWLRTYGINTKHAVELAAQDIVTAPVVIGSVDLESDSPDLLSFSGILHADRDCALDGLAGWFECDLARGVSMTNSPLAADRIDRQQVFLPFDEPIPAASGDQIPFTLSIRHDTGLITWSVRDPRTGAMRKLSTWNSRILAATDLDQDPTKAVALSGEGRARQTILGYIDGRRTAQEIEAAVLRDHPDLFASAEEVSRFVRDELARSAR
jgi:protein arginine N-methyltransferase 1